MSKAEPPLLPQSLSTSSTQHNSFNRFIKTNWFKFLPFTSSSNQCSHRSTSNSIVQNLCFKHRQIWFNRRIIKSIILFTSVFIYFRYLHRFIFIDYSTFPTPSSSVIIHPGIDPEPSVTPFHLDRLLLTNSETHDSPSHQEIPPTSSDQLPHNLLIDLALKEISERFQSVWIQPSTLSCRPSKQTQNLMNSRFLDSNGRPNGHHQVMIALNLHSSQPIISALTTSIFNALRFIGIENVFISIYENGSWDHTPEAMAHLGAVLTGLGVGHQLRSAKEETIWKGADRIKILSEYRNIALSAVHQAELHMKGLTELVFINDVFLCTQDILEIIWERNFQNADASCGTDWRELENISDRFGWSNKQNEDEKKYIKKSETSVVFYDSWVARSLTGKTLRPRLDLLSSYRNGYSVIFDKEPSRLFQTRFQNSLPVPVYSCWNGIISLNPKPFKSPFNLTFRSADRANGECPSSECQLLAKDFWSLGFQKWILVPKVAVTYEQHIYHSNPIVLGSNRDHEPRELSSHTNYDDNPDLFHNNNRESKEDDDYSNEKINWRKYQKPETIVCWPDVHGFHLDFEWNHVLESPYNLKLLNTTITNQTSLYF